MEIDIDNTIIKICHEGIKEETHGRSDEALQTFMRAWDESKNNYDSCIVAHYIARFQTTPEEKFYWNKVALDNAELSPYHKVKKIYPSLYLNMASSYEELSNFKDAITYYNLTFEKLIQLIEGLYLDTIRDAVSRGINRIKPYITK